MNNKYRQVCTMHAVASVGFEFSLLKVLRMMSSELLSRLHHLRIEVSSG
jgi:hypothetical protein